MSSDVSDPPSSDSDHQEEEVAEKTKYRKYAVKAKKRLGARKSRKIHRVKKPKVGKNPAKKPIVLREDNTVEQGKPVKLYEIPPKSPTKEEVDEEVDEAVDEEKSEEEMYDENEEDIEEENEEEMDPENEEHRTSSIDKGNKPEGNPVPVPRSTKSRAGDSRAARSGPPIQSELFPNTVISYKRDLPQNRDIMLLKSGGEMNDELMTYFFNSLHASLPPEKRANTYIFSPFFYGTLRGRIFDGKISHINACDIMMRESKAENIFGKELLLFPIGVNRHWSLVIVRFPKGQVSQGVEQPKPILLILDSINTTAGEIGKNILIFLEGMRMVKEMNLGYDIPNIRIRVPKVPKQDNHLDCGLYVMEFAWMIFEKPFRNWDKPDDKSKWFTKSSIDLLRNKLFADIMTEKLLHEPASVKDLGLVRLPPIHPCV